MEWKNLKISESIDYIIILSMHPDMDMKNIEKIMREKNLKILREYLEMEEL